MIWVLFFGLFQRGPEWRVTQWREVMPFDVCWVGAGIDVVDMWRIHRFGVRISENRSELTFLGPAGPISLQGSGPGLAHLRYVLSDRKLIPQLSLIDRGATGPLLTFLPGTTTNEDGYFTTGRPAVTLRIDKVGRFSFASDLMPWATPNLCEQRP